MSITKTTTSWAKALALALVAAFAAMIALAIAPPAYADEGGDTPIVAGAKALDDASEYGTLAASGACNDAVNWAYYVNNEGNTFVFSKNAESTSSSFKIPGFSPRKPWTDPIANQLVNEDGSYKTFSTVIIEEGIEGCSSNLVFEPANETNYTASIKTIKYPGSWYYAMSTLSGAKVESVSIAEGFEASHLLSSLNETINGQIFSFEAKDSLKNLTFPSTLQSIPYGCIDQYKNLEWIRFQAMEWTGSEAGQTVQHHIINIDPTIYYPQGATGYVRGEKDEEGNMLPFKEDAVLVAVPDIDGLPALADVTIDDEEKIISVREAWDALTPEQAALVGTWVDYSKLMAAEEALELTKELTAVKAEIASAIEAAKAIDTSTFSDEQKAELEAAIAAAEKAVDQDGATVDSLKAAIAALELSAAKAEVIVAKAATAAAEATAQAAVKEAAEAAKALEAATQKAIAAEAAKKAAEEKAASGLKDNPITVTSKVATAKAKKKTTIKKAKAFDVKDAKGKVSFYKVKGNAKINVKANGNVVVKKGLKKGKTYKVKVLVVAAGDKSFAPCVKTVTLKVKIK